jgi:hypothetical protein
MEPHQVSSAVCAVVSLGFMYVIAAQMFVPVLLDVATGDDHTDRPLGRFLVMWPVWLAWKSCRRMIRLTLK